VSTDSPLFSPAEALSDLHDQVKNLPRLADGRFPFPGMIVWNVSTAPATGVLRIGEVQSVIRDGLAVRQKARGPSMTWILSETYGSLEAASAKLMPWIQGLKALDYARD